METSIALLEVLPQVGRLEWIGLRPERMAELTPVAEVEAVAERGLAGDHKVTGRAGAKRQVTLIQQEHLVAVAGLLHRDEVSPGLVRRNLVISGINLLALKGKQFEIGEVRFEFSGPCEPCSRMEDNLGQGGLNAMRGHGGITAMVLAGGVMRVGDAVRAVTPGRSSSAAQSNAAE